ncbi:hypothetical protein BC828DRAFT_387197 [Blastocladiella britannica]|nr:hypothetical protein BC828DRAFT_387197 [Blastocladiella britannica]
MRVLASWAIVRAAHGHKHEIGHIAEPDPANAQRERGDAHDNALGNALDALVVVRVGRELVRVVGLGQDPVLAVKVRVESKPGAVRYHVRVAGDQQHNANHNQHVRAHTNPAPEKEGQRLNHGRVPRLGVAVERVRELDQAHHFVGERTVVGHEWRRKNHIGEGPPSDPKSSHGSEVWRPCMVVPKLFARLLYHCAADMEQFGCWPVPSRSHGGQNQIEIVAHPNTKAENGARDHG